MSNTIKSTELFQSFFWITAHNGCSNKVILSRIVCDTCTLSFSCHENYVNLIKYFVVHLATTAMSWSDVIVSTANWSKNF